MREDHLAEDLPPLLAELNKNAEAGAEEIVLAQVPDDRTGAHSQEAPRDPHQPKPKVRPANAMGPIGERGGWGMPQSAWLLCSLLRGRAQLAEYTLERAPA